MVCDNGREFASKARKPGWRWDLPARQTDSECFRRELDWQVTGRMPEPPVVQNHGRSEDRIRSMANSVQPHQTPIVR